MALPFLPEYQGLFCVIARRNRAKVLLNPFIEVKAHGFCISNPETTHLVTLAGNPVLTGDSAERVKQILVGNRNNALLLTLRLGELEALEALGALEFIKQNQSPETIISAVVHLDEKSPHMHLCFVPLTEDKRLCAKEILGNKKKLTQWQDKYWEHMVKKYPDLERGESASETGRDHIPTRVFKQMARLNKQHDKLVELLSDVKLTNYKDKTAQVVAFLEKYIPDVAAMETQIKKYEKFFKTADGKQKALEKKNVYLTDALEKSQQESTVKKLQELRLQSDYERVKGILDRIPPEIIRAYTHRDSKTQEVRHYK